MRVRFYFYSPTTIWLSIMLSQLALFCSTRSYPKPSRSSIVPFSSSPIKYGGCQYSLRQKFKFSQEYGFTHNKLIFCTCNKMRQTATGISGTIRLVHQFGSIGSQTQKTAGGKISGFRGKWFRRQNSKDSTVLTYSKSPET